MLMKVFFHFYKRIFMANFSLAFVFSTFAWYDPNLMLKTFVIVMPTFAYGLTLFFFEMYKLQYYMYRNLGYAKWKLILFGFVANSSVSLLVYAIGKAFLQYV